MKNTKNEVINEVITEVTTVVAETPKVTKTSRIIEMYESGCDFETIRTEMGIRYQFVYNVISNYCLKSGQIIRLNRKTDGKKDKIIGLLNEGKTVNEIVSELKVSTNYIYKVKKELVTQ